MRLRHFCVVVLLLTAALTSAAAENQTVELVVRKGNSLIEICNTYLEPGARWQKIAKLNRLKNPHKIYPGQKIVVPVDMLRGVPIEGAITFLKGDVQLRMSGQQWQRPLLNGRVSQGCGIKTGANGTIEINFKDEVSFLVRADTTLEIKSARQKGLILKVFDFFMGTGRAIARIRHLTGRATRFEISTPSAVAAARGTDFRVGADAAGDTRCEVLEGKVALGAAFREVMVAKGQGAYVKKGQPPQPPRQLLAPPAPMNLQTLYKSLPVRIAFEKEAQAVRYRIFIANDRLGKDLVMDKRIKPGQDFEIIDLADGDTYQIQLAKDLSFTAPITDRGGIKSNRFIRRYVCTNDLPPWGPLLP